MNYKNRELARTAVTLSPVGEAILVRLKSSSEYLGFLEAKIGKLISQILKNSSAELAAFISFEPISNSTNLTAKHIYAIIYAPHEEVELIGIALSRDEIFLQHPTSIDDGVQYENPHFLIRPGRAIEVPIRSEQDIMARQSVLSRREVEKLFKSAEGPHVFSEIQASQIVKTTLTRLVPSLLGSQRCIQ